MFLSPQQEKFLDFQYLLLLLQGLGILLLHLHLHLQRLEFQSKSFLHRFH
jgi:hypothetical protein